MESVNHLIMALIPLDLASLLLLLSDASLRLRISQTKYDDDIMAVVAVYGQIDSSFIKKSVISLKLTPTAYNITFFLCLRCTYKHFENPYNISVKYGNQIYDY